MNNLYLNGRLTADVEAAEKKINNKDSLVYANFTIAYDTGAESADFYRVVAFNQTAKYLAEYGVKGAKIGISAHLKQDKFNDAEGKARSSISIVCDRVEFLEYKEKEAEAVPASKTSYSNKRYAR